MLFVRLYKTANNATEYWLFRHIFLYLFAYDYICRKFKNFIIMSSNNQIINLPSKLKAILNKNEELEISVFKSIIPFFHILKENTLSFFPKYTDHGIKHIESVLRDIENMISDDTLAKLSPIDVAVLLLATVLHDIGMHTSLEMFKKMIEGEYDNIDGNLFKEKTWRILWHEYLKSCRYWGQDKKKNVFGDENHVIKTPNLDDIQLLNGYDIRLIGEFIRTHHARIAYEIALKGYMGKSTTYGFDSTELPSKMIQIAGLVARSHGIDIRDLFDVLKSLSGKSWKKPNNIKVVYLMVLIRLADYIQINSSNTDKTQLQIKSIPSSFSLKENASYIAIEYIQLENDDDEKIVVEADPQDAEMFVKIEKLIHDIQHEFDLSWAILGEVYNNEYKLQFRRIETNITDPEVKARLDYVPQQFRFIFNNELSKLLIAPLYGNNPSFGVRELVQNSVDACRTRMAINKEYKNSRGPHVEVSLTDDVFTISDSGIGMTIEEIQSFFLTIGSSFNQNIEWKKTRDTYNTYRTGRFGIGVLAAFLLGDEISVNTRSINSNVGYSFKTSLDNRFIQINRVDGLEVGTEIKIQLNEISRDSLTREVRAYLRKKSPKNKQNRSYYLEDYLDDSFSLNRETTPYWFNWYINDLPNSPTVEYRYNRTIIKPHQVIKDDGYKALTHASLSYGDVFWKPQPLFSNQNQKQSLYCNGIFITNESNKNHFSVRVPGVWYNLLHFPSLIVSDLYNQLPINLQRNSIEGTIQYDFEDDLVKAMQEDVLCQLVSIVRFPKSSHRHFYFSSIGFALANEYTKKWLNDKYIFHVGLIKEIDDRLFLKWKDIFELCSDVVFSFHIESLGFIANDREGTNTRRTKDWISKYDSFAILAEVSDSTPSVDRNIIDTIKHIDNLTIEIDYKSGFIVPIKNINSGVKTVLNRTIQLLKDSHIASPCYILIERIEQKEKKSTTLFDSTFDNYTDIDPFIPYDYSSRKNKFRKLFDEHSDDIKRYRNQNMAKKRD